MLSRLEIRDFALIDYHAFDLKEGLTVLTGETGAGKSIIIDSIGAITGNRVNKDMIRHGCEAASVTAVFDGDDVRQVADILGEAGIETEEQALIITREIYQNGKTYARINGKLVPLSLMKEITRNLLDIHGQHENQSIFKQEMQLDLLDRFAGEPVAAALRDYQKKLGPYSECLVALREFTTDDSQKEQMIDILEFQIKEIKGIHPKLNEDAELTERRKLLSHAEKIKTTLEESLFYLDGETNMPALASVIKSKNIIEHQLGSFNQFQLISEKLTEVQYQVEEICETLRAEVEKVEIQPGELESIDDRLDRLYRIKKKYGGSIESVLEFYKNAVQKLNFIKSSEDRIRELTKQKEDYILELRKASDLLYEQRKLAAGVLEDKIRNELTELGMKGTGFFVKILHQENGSSFSKTGQDQVEFMISPNVGEELKPLSRIASGGEASRIMLAIKTILADSDRIPLLIFDEVDTGISGKTAGLMGDKLLRISHTHQVLCVTHMAQIAAKATNHIYIEKNVANNKTTTSLCYLSEEGRVSEVARLLSGGQNVVKAMDLAKEMILSNIAE